MAARARGLKCTVVARWVVHHRSAENTKRFGKSSDACRHEDGRRNACSGAAHAHRSGRAGGKGVGSAIAPRKRIHSCRRRNAW